LSRHELFDAYIAREINRRAFVQGLMALGVSAGVAASYAVALQPAAAGDGGGGGGDQCNTNLPPDLYELYCNPPTTPVDPDGDTTDDKRKKRRRKKRKKKH